jgi:thiamine transporter ThiT
VAVGRQLTWAFVVAQLSAMAFVLGFVPAEIVQNFVSVTLEWNPLRVAAEPSVVGVRELGGVVAGSLH